MAQQEDHYGTTLHFARPPRAGALAQAGRPGQQGRQRRGPLPVHGPRAPAFDFYVVLDFEATCDDGGAAGARPFPLHLQEIIEFPCVLVDARQTPPTVVSETQVYVRPVAVPQLTRFCTELTGITQATVESGTTFRDAMRSNCAWLRANHLDPLNPAARFAVVTCGNWDLESMLPRQLALLRRLGQRVPDEGPTCYRRWVNIQASFRACYGVRAGGMKNMLRQLGIPLSGRHHSGIDDCRNTAKIVVRMLQDGWALPLTSYAPRCTAPRQPCEQVRECAALRAPRDENMPCAPRDENMPCAPREHAAFDMRATAAPGRPIAGAVVRRLDGCADVLCAE